MRCRLKFWKYMAGLEIELVNSKLKAQNKFDICN